MSDEIMNHGHGHETEFEHEDLGTRGVFAFMIGARGHWDRDLFHHRRHVLVPR